MRDATCKTCKHLVEASYKCSKRGNVRYHKCDYLKRSVTAAYGLKLAQTCKGYEEIENTQQTKNKPLY